MLKNIILMIYLAYGAYQDKKELQISALYLKLGAVCSGGYFVFQLVQTGGWAADEILRLLPGMLMLIYGRITKEKIGYGDGSLMLILAGLLSARELLSLWSLSFLLSALAAVYFLFIKKEDKNKRMAFYPYVGAAYVMLWGVGYV